MGNVVNLIRRRAADDEAQNHNVQGDVAQAMLAEDSRLLPEVRAQLHADARFVAESRERVEALLNDVRKQHDLLERVIDAMLDEQARTRFRDSLRALRRQIDCVRTIATSI